MHSHTSVSMRTFGCVYVCVSVSMCVCLRACTCVSVHMRVYVRPCACDSFTMCTRTQVSFKALPFSQLVQRNIGSPGSCSSALQ